MTRIRAALTAPISAWSLVAFRVLFGALMLVAVVRFFAHGWIAEYYVAPSHFFTYYGLDWIRPWPGPGMYIHFAAMGGCAALVMVGLWYRPAIAAFGALFAYAHLCDKTNYLNHYYLLILLSALMVVLPLADVGSVDAWRRRRRTGEVRPAIVPAWPLWVIRGQLACVYVFGGVAKLGSDWLVHAQPLKTWLAAATDVPLLGPLLAQPWAPHVGSWGAALFDLTIVGWLLWPRTRTVAWIAVVGFHVVTARLFHLGMFPWVMIAFSTVFFAPDWPARVVARLRGHVVATTTPPAPASSVIALPAPPHRALRAALLAHFALQILLPLRAFAYPGDPLWTEQGFRFAWRVMLMEKSGVVDLRVRDPDTGRTWVLPATTYATRYQASMAASQPDMILELAHWAAADFRGRGVRAPEVRVDAWVSLNGRPRQRLIDPDVDLAREVDSLLPQPWILPLAAAAPP